MELISSVGAVANQFVNYDPINNPQGTVYSAEWGNDVQKAITEVELFAGFVLAPETNQLLRSIQKISTESGKFVGEYFHLDSYKTPSAWNPTLPNDYFPAICLSSINIQTVLSQTNYPLLVPHLRSVKAAYLKGKSGEVSAFTGTAAGSVVTLDNNTANNRLLASLAEDVLVHGGYSDYRCLTISGTEYPITNINTVTRQVTLFSAPPAGSVSCEFYPHRIAGSTTTAREFEVSGKTLISSDDNGGYWIGGLRKRSFMQGHRFFSGLAVGGADSNAMTYGFTISDIPGVASGAVFQRTASTPLSQPITSTPKTDDVNGTPRTGAETHSPVQSGFLYKWARNFIA